MSSCLDKDITYLNLSTNISCILKDNNINKVSDLWINSRKNLKNMGMNDSEIKEIIIKLELNGLDLNKRVNK